MKFVDSDSPERVLRALRSVVSIRPAGSKPTDRSLRSTPATGFYVGEDVIVTARHTAMQSTRARIHDVSPEHVSDFSVEVKRLRSNLFEELSLPAHGTDVSYDIAYFGLEEQPRDSLMPLKIGDRPDCGEWLMLLGVTHNPKDGYVAKYSAGKLYEVRQFADQPALLLFEAPTQLGASGGPVIRAKTGKVVGVLSGALESNGRKLAMAWALSAEDVPWTMRLAKSLKRL